MRRREAYAQHPQPAPKPVQVVWAEPPRAEPGHCPKCGKYFGRAVRSHARRCGVRPELQPPE